MQIIEWMGNFVKGDGVLLVNVYERSSACFCGRLDNSQSLEKICLASGRNWITSLYQI